MAGATYNYILNEDGQSYSITCKNPTIVDWATIPTVNSTDNLPVTRIGDNAFKNCPYLVTVNIGDNITEIGNSAFENCVVLKKIGLRNGIYISNNITSIGNNAFAGCTALDRVFIPNSNVSIGNNAFAGCTALEDMVMLSITPNNIGENVFDNTPNATIWVYQDCESAYKEASGWKTYADKIEGNNNRINFILAGTKITETYLPYPPDYSTVPSYSTVVGITQAGATRNVEIGHSTHGLKFYGKILMIAGASQSQTDGLSNQYFPVAPNTLKGGVVSALSKLTGTEFATVQAALGFGKKLYTHALIFHKSGSLNFTVDRITSEPTAYLNCTTPMADNLFCTNSKSIVLNGINDPSGVKSGVGTFMATMTPYDDENGENSGVKLSGIWINYATGEVSQVSNFEVPFEQDVVTEL